MRRIFGLAGIALALFTLTACAKKPTAKLVMGKWEIVAKPSLYQNLSQYGDTTTHQLLVLVYDKNLSESYLTYSKNQLEHGRGKIAYSFDAKKALITYDNGNLKYSEKVSFDASGNIMTQEFTDTKLKQIYYRVGSQQDRAMNQAMAAQAKALRQEVKSVNALWYKKQTRFIDDFTSAVKGKWDNKTGNAQVDLKRDSPEPPANFSLAKTGKTTFTVSFSQINKTSKKLVQFDNQQASQPQIVYPEGAWQKIFGNTQLKVNQLKSIKQKIQALSFRDLYMKFGYLSLNYYLPNHYVQKIGTNAYAGTSVHGNVAHFPFLNLSTQELSEQSGAVPQPLLTNVEPSK